MLTKAQIQELRMKILPTGGGSIIDILNQHREFVTVTSIALENVPMVIIAKHGILARLPIHGSIQKYSNAKEIVDALKIFFEKKEMLYLYINLPAFHVPSYVDEMLFEVTKRDDQKQQLIKMIDEALQRKDQDTFKALSLQLQALENQEE